MAILEVLVPFFAVLFLLVVVHEFGHFSVAKLFHMLVEEFGFGMPPRIGGIRLGETLYSLNWLPIGGFVKIYGEELEDDPTVSETAEGRADSDIEKRKERAFHERPWWQRSLVLLAGPAMNILLAVVILSVLFTQGTYVPSSQVRILGVEKGSPAYESGMQKGDVVTDVESGGITHRIQLMTDLTTYSKKYAGKEMTLTVKRDGKIMRLTLVPRANPPKGKGAMGVEISQFEFIKTPWYSAPFEGTRQAARISVEFYSELGRALSKLVMLKNPEVEVTGPVGIAKITGNAAKSGAPTLWMFIALFSLNLALINLLPFPALDGGQLVFVLYEAVTRHKVSLKFRTIVNSIGFSLLILLMLIITVVDIRRFFF